MTTLGQETIHRQTFFIDDLKTRSITLYPTYAAIVRDIDNVTIEPGRNEITILGLTLFADENSIKIEGHGTDAMITDILVDRRRNPRYNEAFSSDSEESDEEPAKNLELEKVKREIESLLQDTGDADEAMRSASNQLAYLERHTSSLCIPTDRDGLAFVSNTKLMAGNLDNYDIHRGKIYRKYKEAQVSLREIKEDIASKQVQAFKLEKAQRKARRGAGGLAREKDEERLEKLEQKSYQPQWIQRVRITIESDSFLKNTPFIASAISTGRPTRKEDDDPPEKSSGPSLRISYITTGASWIPRYDLRLDTTSGTGVLTYRAQFLNRTGELWRDASITLSTSQTSLGGLESKIPWMDSWRMTLRKRETHGAYKEEGLYSQKEKAVKDSVKLKHGVAQSLNIYSPVCKPAAPAYDSAANYNHPQPNAFNKAFSAPITNNLPAGSGFPHPQAPQYAGGLFGPNTANKPTPSSGGLFGNAPFTPKGPSAYGGFAASTPTQSSGGGLFGNASVSQQSGSPFGANIPNNPAPPSGSLFGSSQAPQNGGLFGGNSASTPNPPSGGLFGNAAVSGQDVNLFGGNSASAPAIPPSGGLFGNITGSLFGPSNASRGDQAPMATLEPQDRDPYDSSPSDPDGDAATLNPPQKMGLASSISTSYGLTTTYDLSGTRTISSSSLVRRHVIAEYSLPDIEFSHFAVPKLRAAAFLRAKIRNPTSTPLLKGPVGLTLDGSFLGNEMMPRCAPGETFELGLGADKEVLVEYRKPIKRTASQGVLVKEQVITYERGIRVYNSRVNAIKLVLFDQIPVSEDERLRFTIVKPKGLRNVGDILKSRTSAGSAVTSEKNTDNQCSEVVMELRKGGEIRYEVKLEKGNDAILSLEYEARLPAGEAMLEL